LRHRDRDVPPLNA